MVRISSDVGFHLGRAGLPLLPKDTVEIAGLPFIYIAIWLGGTGMYQNNSLSQKVLLCEGQAAALV